jgi:hypothetical protein
MDLTGNLYEPYISIYNTVTITTTFTNAAGDGELDSEGYHDAPSWPSRSGNADYAIALPKGGTWLYNQNYATVSRRNESNFYDDYNFVISHNSYGLGGRGGR